MKANLVERALDLFTLMNAAGPLSLIENVLTTEAAGQYTDEEIRAVVAVARKYVGPRMSYSLKDLPRLVIMAGKLADSRKADLLDRKSVCYDRKNRLETTSPRPQTAAGRMSEFSGVATPGGHGPSSGETLVEGSRDATATQ